MMIYLTKSKSGTRDITDILTYWTWSGDKSTISRQLTGEVAYIENSQLPVPEIGDLVTMTDGGEKKFVGIVLQRSLGSEDSTPRMTAAPMTAMYGVLGRITMCGHPAPPARSGMTSARLKR